MSLKKYYSLDNRKHKMWHDETINIFCLHSISFMTVHIIFTVHIQMAIIGKLLHILLRYKSTVSSFKTVAMKIIMFRDGNKVVFSMFLMSSNCMVKRQFLFYCYGNSSCFSWQLNDCWDILFGSTFNNSATIHTSIRNYHKWENVQPWNAIFFFYSFCILMTINTFSKYKGLSLIQKCNKDVKIIPYLLFCNSTNQWIELYLPNFSKYHLIVLKGVLFIFF